MWRNSHKNNINLKINETLFEESRVSSLQNLLNKSTPKRERKNLVSKIANMEKNHLCLICSDKMV